MRASEAKQIVTFIYTCEPLVPGCEMKLNHILIFHLLYHSVNATAERSNLTNDIIHDREFFMSSDSFKSSLKYGSSFLPRHLYDVHFLTKSDKSEQSSYSFTSPNQVLPPGFQNLLLQPLYDPVAMATALVQLKDCLAQLDGYTDPDLGTFNLDPHTYCTPQTTKFIPGITCCAPQKPDELQARLLLFPAARGNPRQPVANYGLGGEARFARSAQSNYGPQTVPVTELNWRSKTRPKLIPSTGRIVYLIHGFGDNVTSSVWIRPAAQAWNARGATVIAVDWKNGQGYPFQAAADMRLFGAMIARRSLLVGHSVGAQAVSEAANFAKGKGIKLPECTGLDPAGAMFDGGPPQTRITRDDCKLVTIIHSSAEYAAFSTGIIGLRLGTLYKSGHCDYWVNCGHDQGPRCTDPRFGDFLRREATALVEQYPACAHFRATLVYVAQLRGDCNFRSVHCQNCGTKTNNFNYHPFNDCKVDPSGGFSGVPPFHGCNSQMNANFYLKTTDRYPFC